MQVLYKSVKEIDRDHGQNYDGLVVIGEIIAGIGGSIRFDDNQ